MKETLILGMGNPIISDDGIGSRIAVDLMKDLSIKHFDIETVPTNSLDLISLISGYRNLIVIDGKKTNDGVPGDISIFNVSKYHGTLHLDNYHDVNFHDMIEMGEKLKIDLPANIQIIAIEICEDLLFNDNLSNPLKSIYDSILQEVKDNIQRLSLSSLQK